MTELDDKNTAIELIGECLVCLLQYNLIGTKPTTIGCGHSLCLKCFS